MYNASVNSLICMATCDKSLTIAIHLVQSRTFISGIDTYRNEMTILKIWTTEKRWKWMVSLLRNIFTHTIFPAIYIYNVCHLSCSSSVWFSWSLELVHVLLVHVLVEDNKASDVLATTVMDKCLSLSVKLSKQQFHKYSWGSYIYPVSAIYEGLPSTHSRTSCIFHLQ